MTKSVIGHTQLLYPKSFAGNNLGVIRWGIIGLIGICCWLLSSAPLLAQEVDSSSNLLQRLRAARTQEVASTGEAAVAPAVSSPLVVDGTPPLPFAQPQLGPNVVPIQSTSIVQSASVAQSDQSVSVASASVAQNASAEQGALHAATVSSRETLLGVTGYGFGQSSIGTGLDIIHNAEDMEARSTEIDPSLIHVPEDFTFPDIAANERWIRVDLGEQQVVAYEGMTPVRAFIASTGLPGTQTVTGEFRVRTKVSRQVMSGVGYSLPNVKWVMYFHSEYALHGSYWHENFGNPMSHGCVNMTNADSKWLFDFAGPVWDGQTVWYHSTEENPGTRVVVHD